MYLYKILNTVSGSVYIGITRTTIYQRYAAHKSSAKRGVKTPLYDAMRSYGIDKFIISVIAEYTTDEDLLFAEKSTIAMLRESGIHVYNILDGGESYFPIKDKEDWKRKLSKARQGRTPAKGMKHTEENKAYFANVANEYWKENKVYPDDLIETIINMRCVDAMREYGISKTHFYRLRKGSRTDK